LHSGFAAGAVVIQTTTFQGFTNGHDHVLLQLQTGIGSEGAVWNHEITNNVVPLVTADSVFQFAASENLTLYANNSTSGITAQIFTDGGNPIILFDGVTGGLGGTVTLIGYTVNVGTAAAPSTN